MGYIVKPLVTEKMTAITEKQNNMFGFIVRHEANKIEIKEEVEAKYCKFKVPTPLFEVAK